MRRHFDISVGIPAYGRPEELCQLLSSIHAQTVLPVEITVCEDQSPNRAEIRSIIDEWRKAFNDEGCHLNYQENAINLGYDGNIRRVIASSRSRWVILMGNDDLLLPECIETCERYIQANNELPMISRSFVRFMQNLDHPSGVSRISHNDEVFRAGQSSSKMIMRSTGFVGGLIVDRMWADSIATDRYDGTLYYQVFLACVAFCENGIGYIGQPIVGGRNGNKPLFGAAESERSVHIPGSYTPQARAQMWSSIIRISDEIGQRYQMDLATDIRHELEVRSCFHVFEMYVGSDKKTLDEMRAELRKIGLFSHPVPRGLYWLNVLLGRAARGIYIAARLIVQRS